MPFDVLNVDQMFSEIVATHFSQEVSHLQNVLISIITHPLCALKQVNTVCMIIVITLEMFLKFSVQQIYYYLISLFIFIYIYFTVGGTYITVRGCAPFDSITFNRGMQRQMVGTYWKGFNIFSLCDYDQCNGARNLGGLSLFSSMILLLVHKLF